MIRQLLTTLSGVVGVIALAQPASATSVKDLTLKETVGASKVIVRARVESRRVAWGMHQGRRAIVTTLTFDKVKVLKGRALRRLTVFGGTIGARTLKLIGQPELHKKDEVLLLVDTDPRLPCPYVGIWQGVYLLRKGRVYRQGRPVVDVVRGRIVLGKDNERAMSEKAFLAEVRLAIRKTAAEKPPAKPKPPVEEERATHEDKEER